jgi:Protein of unknown function (DUF2946)
MDQIVKAAMRKWPTVPHCYGWLALDARGDWYLRDEPTQAAGAFPQPKGSRIEHDGLREFIQRNYEPDARGCWYFQNGPQRVYVELEAAPWVFRLDVGTADGADAADTAGGWNIRLPGERLARYRAAWLDERGRLFLDCDLGFGLVHSLDTDVAARAIEAGDWHTREMEFARMPGHFGYVLRPQADSPRT